MAELPIKRIILYKHGVGYFERRGLASGESLRLTFPLAAMDDVLKSLVALDLGAGQVLGIDFETPEDRAALLAKGSIHLSDTGSLVDLLRDLRGRRVRLVFGKDNNELSLDGTLIGVDYEAEQRLERGVVTLYQPEVRAISSIPLDKLRRVDLLEDAASDDLTYFLRAAQSEEERRSATLHLTPGEHDLVVGYIAPAPAWRVSYRLLFEEANEPPAAEAEPTASNTDASSTVLLQGWGLFDNQLDEDLAEVRLTMVAGMPVSFRYRLYEPKTPERPFVEDEERTVSAPVFFEGAPPPAPAPMMARAAMVEDMTTLSLAEPEMAKGFSMDRMEEAIQVSTVGGERGALFAYEVSHPVSVARGQSAMVPILSKKLAARRELLYNGQKLPAHPVAGLRLHNETGLTLERGPVTVLENGDYAGEAVVPFTRDGAELIVPFAVELGMKVEEQRTSERRIQAIRVRDEYLLFEEYDFQNTKYLLTSTVARPVDVVIEHTPRNSYELAETPDPTERGASFLRWSVACAAGALTTFTVRERCLVSRQEQVRSQSARELRRYLRNRLLDEATVAGLEEVLGLYHKIDELNKRGTQIEREREALYRQQSQIQGSLGPLGRDGEEGALRLRYVAELNAIEEQLKALKAEQQQLKEQITALEQQILQRLAELTRGTS